MSIVETKLLTAEQFHALPSSLGPLELVRGEVVKVNVPGFRHGNICRRIAGALDRYLEQHDIGDFTTNDSGIVTERRPDSVRGPDIAYFSYERLPPDEDPEAYPDVAPEIVWEVVSPGDSWTKVLDKVREYLLSNVLVACVIDPKPRTFTTFLPDRPEEVLKVGDIWRAAEILPGFELPLDKVFRRGRK